MNVTTETTRLNCPKVDKSSLLDAFARIEMRDADVKSVAIPSALYEQLEGIMLGSASLKELLKIDATLPKGVAVLTPDKEDVPCVELTEVETQPPARSTW